MLLRPKLDAAPEYKILINIGACLDVPTGYPVVGLYGETFINGGLGMLTAIIGKGNSFKSTMMNYMMLSAADRIASATETSISTYDTEINIHTDKLYQFTQSFASFYGKHIIHDRTWLITDKVMYYGNEYFHIIKDYLAEKKSSAPKITFNWPFPDHTGRKNCRIIVPTFGAVDSFTEFQTKDVIDMQEENEIGDKGGNTIFMRQGLAKKRFLMEIPIAAGGAGHYMLMTAHVGKEIEMASGPMPKAPDKKLQYLKNGDKAKGVTDNFYFLMSNCWHAYNAAPFNNKTKFGPEYPKNPDEGKQFDRAKADTDLNIVSLRQLRGKSGPSGFGLDILVSQTQGVLASLTEFHYLKECDRFGISGSDTNYWMDLLPDVKISRTTVRNKLDTNEQLRRVMNITLEMCQIKGYWRTFDPSVLCTPKELYDDLITLGWDWNILLNTRGWATINNEDHSIPFLSTIDLMKMRAGKYHPYWLDADKRTRIKPTPISTS